MRVGATLACLLLGCGRIGFHLQPSADAGASVAVDAQLPDASIAVDAQLPDADANCSAPMAGLIAHWRFDDGIGSTARDRIGGHDGLLTNMDTATAWVAPTADQPGALSFDGADDHVLIDPDSAFDNFANFTVSAWIMPDDVERFARFLTKSEECCLSPPSRGWRFGISENDSALDRGIRFDADFAGGYLRRERNDPTLVTGVWQHVAVSWDGTSDAFNGVHIYVQGMEVVYSYGENGSGARVGDESTAFLIGGTLGGSPGEGFDGLMRDVRVYNRILDANDVARLVMPEPTNCP